MITLSTTLVDIDGREAILAADLDGLDANETSSKVKQFCYVWLCFRCEQYAMKESREKLLSPSTDEVIVA